jgi:hypothetical protein
MFRLHRHEKSAGDHDFQKGTRESIEAFVEFMNERAGGWNTVEGLVADPMRRPPNRFQMPLLQTWADNFLNETGISPS